MVLKGGAERCVVTGGLGGVEKKGGKRHGPEGIMVYIYLPPEVLTLLKV